MMRDAGLRYPLCHVLLLNLCNDAFELLCDHEAMMHLNYYFYVFDHFFKEIACICIFFVFLSILDAAGYVKRVLKCAN
jgi:hypothetical protein